MDTLTVVLEQAKKIVDNPPWLDDDYGRSWCFFCSGQEPKHDDACPYKVMKDALQKQVTD